MASTGAEFGCGVCWIVCEVWMGFQLEDDFVEQGLCLSYEKHSWIPNGELNLDVFFCRVEPDSSHLP